MLLTVFCCLVKHVRAWVLVSREGQVTMLGPIDIDPSFSQEARLTFRQRGVKEWSIGIYAVYGGGGDFVVSSERNGEVTPFFAMTQQAEAFYNTSLSVIDYVKLGSTLSVFDGTILGSSLSAMSKTILGSSMSVRDEAILGSILSVHGKAMLGSTLFVGERVMSGKELSVRNFVRFGGQLPVDDHTFLGSSTLLCSLA